MSRTRVIVAFLLSPFAAALYLLVLVILFDNPAPTRAGEIAAVIVLFVIIGFVAEIVLVLPLLLLFRYFRLMKLHWFLLGGFAIGVIIFGFFDRPVYRIKCGLMYCVVPAVLSTAAFWFLGWSADNKPLDASGGSVFRKMIGPAMLE
jgi:hypothetical protein